LRFGDVSWLGATLRALAVEVHNLAC